MEEVLHPPATQARHADVDVGLWLLLRGYIDRPYVVSSIYTTDQEISRGHGKRKVSRLALKKNAPLWHMAWHGKLMFVS